MSAGTAVGWQPTLGAVVDGSHGCRFTVWAPVARSVQLALHRGPDHAERRAMTPGADGTFALACPDVGPGVRYGFVVDGEGPFPDPASRAQPDGVHGLSMTVDPAAFAWGDRGWTGVPGGDLVIYELHVGTCAAPGTFAGVAARLDDLRRLGVTAIELMPVADFPGARNWGYDGVAPFAPARCYGTPDDLRRLVDAAHAAGLAVLLDVVYNHLGPDGAYLGRYSPYYFTDRHQSPWGAGLDLDGPHSAGVRRYFIENALHWVHEYHVDGLRLDATHAIEDTSPRHFLAELTEAVHAAGGGRHVHVIAEDHRNLAHMVRAPEAGGWGLDAVWADDFHHEMRRRLAGDADGYYRDFTGTVADIATTLAQGWFFTGQPSAYLGGPRGTDPTGIPPRRFVICLQNHDQIGNRALGERLHHQIAPAAYRAASMLLLLTPQTPLLFMGQEWAASSPFLYFTDHEPELGRLVTEGRRREFGGFAAFADAGARLSIPDPQAPGTFDASRLDWQERDAPGHAAVLRLYADILRLRRTLASADASGPLTATALDDATLMLTRTTTDGAPVLVVTRFEGAGRCRVDAPVPAPVGGWTVVATSDDPPYGGPAAAPPAVTHESSPWITFHGPATVVLRGMPPATPTAGGR